MAPRRRRASNSTVATVDESHIRWVKEAKALKPWVSAQPGDEPCFVLNDAVVYLQDGKTLGNPLHTTFEGPFIVRGRLEVEEDQFDRLASPALKDAYIEIPKVTTYSIGYPPATLWIQGEAGWFEIVPSEAYRDMHNEVREAITLYYSVLTSYEEHARLVAKVQKKGKKSLPPPPTLDQIFLKYAVAACDGVFRDEVVERCYKWTRFLIAHFPRETELDWTRTEFANWIINESVKKTEAAAPRAVNSPAVSSTVPAAVKPPVSLDTVDSKQRIRGSRRSSRGRSKSIQSDDIEMKDAPAPATKPATKPPPKVTSKGKSKGMFSSPTIVPSPRNSVAEGLEDAQSLPSHSAGRLSQAGDGSKSVVDLLADVLEEVAVEIGDMRKVTIGSVQTTMWKLWSVKYYQFGRDVSVYFARQLLQRLGPHWRDSPFYEHLKTEAAHPPQPLTTITLEEIPTRLVRRVMKEKPVATAARSLRATPPVPALLKGKNRKAPQVFKDESDEDVPRGKHPRPPMVSRRSGKAAGLRLSSSAKKRPPQDLEDEAGSSSGYPGRASSKKPRLAVQDDDNDEDMRDVHDAGTKGQASEDDDEEVDEDLDEDQADPDGLAVPPPKDAVRIVVHAEKLPARSPTGPNGTWVCDHELCNYVVRAAEGRDGQEEIERHFHDHAVQAEKMNLAVVESRRGGHAPIHHLLERIQNLGKRVLIAERGALQGELLPAPIKRRLLV